MDIIKILIKDRRERPNLRMYTALLHSYVNSEEGTAGKLRRVLEDMDAAGIELDGRAAECALEALSVHPDYLLRTDILEYMKTRWFPLSDRGHNFVVAGLLRERSFEQALGKLEEMIEKRIKVEDWLWDKTLWILLEFDEVEEAFHVLSIRQSLADHNMRMSSTLWLRLLDAAAKKYMSEAASMIWNAQIIPGYINPPTGTCLQILSATARSGDVKLATDVFRLLSERDTVFKQYHYEALIECYLAAKDLHAALSIVIIMQDANLQVDEDTLHPLLKYLTKQESRPTEAFARLQILESSSKNVPTAAVNVCLRAALKQNRFADAIEMYKALNTVSKAGPTTATYNILFWACQKEGRKDLAMYFTEEMIQLGVQPDRVTYDRLISVCVSAGDLEDALLYYEESKVEGHLPGRGVLETLIKAMARNRDERCLPVLQYYKEREDVRVTKAVALEQWVKKLLVGREDRSI